MTDHKTTGLYVDEVVVRIIAAQVILITLLFLFTQSAILALLLAGDFALRAFTPFPAPLTFTGKAISNLFTIAPQPIFASPKRFAAALGFTFSLVISVFLYSGLLPAAYVTGGILLFCAVLESVFKICLGCYVYNWVVLPIQNKISNRN